MTLIDQKHFGWQHAQALPPHGYTCAYCDQKVSSARGYKLGAAADGGGPQRAALHICPHCGNPTFFGFADQQVPAVAFGSSVPHVPDDLGALFSEDRNSTSAGAFTGAVLLARKMLMHIAVEQGAATGQSFLHYVEFLSDKGFVPPNGKHWVDHIRKKGNEATHEIQVMADSDAKELLVFLEMLLRFIYEFPKLVPPP